MHIIRSSPAMAATLDSLADDDPVKHILQQRTDELAEYGTDIGGLACFVLIEPGDTLFAIEAELNLPIVANTIDGSRYGQPDFTPSWEWILDHGGCWELPFIMTDDGYGHVLIVPDRDGIDPELLTLCRDHAEAPKGS